MNQVIYRPCSTCGKDTESLYACGFKLKPLCIDCAECITRAHMGYALAHFRTLNEGVSS